LKALEARKHAAAVTAHGPHDFDQLASPIEIEAIPTSNKVQVRLVEAAPRGWRPTCKPGTIAARSFRSLESMEQRAASLACDIAFGRSDRAVIRARLARIFASLARNVEGRR